MNRPAAQCTLSHQSQPIRCLPALLLLSLLAALPAHAQVNNGLYTAGEGWSCVDSNGNNCDEISCTGLTITPCGQSATPGQSVSSAGLYNTFVGFSSGLSHIGGDWNSFFGTAAGYRNTSGQDNTFIGAMSGYKNTNGADNTYVGARAGAASTGGDNTFVGCESGEFNTTGKDNTFIGEEAGHQNTEGDRNTFVGEDAGRTNTTGESNTGIGRAALYDVKTSVNNTGLGHYAGVDIGSGECNTMLGANAGAATESADFNTFVGYAAGSENNRTNGTSNANNNTYVGAWAGQTNREGSNNVVVGAFADMGDVDESQASETCKLSNLWNNPIASVNIDTNVSRVVSLGTSNYVKGDDAVGVGYGVTSNGHRGIAIGSGAVSTHDDAVAVGYGAATRAANQVVLGNATTSSWEAGADATTALGSQTYRFSDIWALSAHIRAAVGADATATLAADNAADNADSWQLKAANDGDFTVSTKASGSYVPVMTLASSGNVTVAGDITLNSDARLKTNISPIDDALDLVCALEGKTYTWHSALRRGEAPHFGLLAQEVQEVVPELVSQALNGVLSVNYLGFVPLLIDSVRTLRARMDAQDEERALLRERIALQQTEIALLREQVALLRTANETRR